MRLKSRHPPTAEESRLSAEGNTVAVETTNVDSEAKRTSNKKSGKEKRTREDDEEGITDDKENHSKKRKKTRGKTVTIGQTVFEFLEEKPRYCYEIETFLDGIDGGYEAYDEYGEECAAYHGVDQLHSKICHFFQQYCPRTLLLTPSENETSKYRTALRQLVKFCAKEKYLSENEYKQILKQITHFGKTKGGKISREINRLYEQGWWEQQYPPTTANKAEQKSQTSS